MIISNNNIIKINKGDTFTFPILMNIGSGCEPNIYFLKDVDRVFLSICENNQSFQDGIIRKIASKENQDKYGYVDFEFLDNDTINLLPGTYYYEVKLIKNYDIKYRASSRGIQIPSCSEEYEIVVESAKLDVFYCDCNSFATILKEGGSTDNLSKHVNADIDNSIINNFNTLSRTYTNFINQFEFEDTFIEYNLIPNSTIYNLYSNFFNKAKEIYNDSNLLLAKNSKSTIKTSGMIGISKPFLISQKNYFYSENDYITAIANSLGYDDVELFKDYSQRLINKFLSSFANRNILRLEYDGAIYTVCKCFIMPYVFKNQNLTDSVLSFIILDQRGLLSIWVDDIESFFKSVNFEKVLSDSNLLRLDIYGRCTLFEIRENCKIETISSKRKFIIMD